MASIQRSKEQAVKRSDSQVSTLFMYQTAHDVLGAWLSMKPILKDVALFFHMLL
jgi:hypothetical protein